MTGHALYLDVMALPSQKGDPVRRVTLKAELTFCFSCEQFVISELTEQDGRGKTTASLV